MPAPSSCDEFLELIRKSGVVDATRLDPHLERLRQNGQLPQRPVDFARQLVSDGILTHFQAEQFLQGKWRRFTIGKYRVLERLGAGGMGAVYLCEHMLMRRRVAVKVLPESKSNDSSSLDRFYREARAVAALDHPNIVRAYDIDRDEKLHFLVMEHVDGSSLQEIIKKTGCMDTIRAAHYIRQAALGLQHAHDAARIVHRDIKPGNILVDRNGIVKILDMGLARFFHDDQDDITRKNDENVLGTADYLAPEQALDSHTADIRADIYSLGGTFYYCLTGRPPFSEGTVAQKLIWHQTRQPKSVRVIRPEVPEGLVAVLEKMMAKDPRERFQTPLEVADALAPWTQTPIPPPPESEMPQFSLAVRGGMPSTIGAAGLSSSKGTRGGESLPSPAPRKPWQVTSTSSAPATPAPNSPPPVPSYVPPSSAPQGNTPPVRSLPVSPAPTPIPPSFAPSPPGLAAETLSTAVVAPPTLEQLPDATTEEPVLPALEPSTLSRRGRRDRAETSKAPPRNRTILYLVIAAGVLVPLTGVLLWVLLSGGDKTPKGGGNLTKAREPIYVKPGGSLKPILNSARSGDRIILMGDLTESDVAVKQPNITIEADAGKTIVWRCPENAPPGCKLLIVQGAAGFQLRGITLDGAGKTDGLVVLYGKTPGATLDNLHLKNSRKYGVLVTNCEGTKDSPVTLSNLTFETPAGQSAIHFDLQQHSMGTVRVNRFFRLKDLKFTGPGLKLTTGDAAFVEIESFEKPRDLTVERAP